MSAKDGRRLFEHLQVLDDLPPRDGALNMAVDETLLGQLEDIPLLRFYRWQEPTVSFGYFESWQAVAELYPRQKLVRRWTGGGIVEHGGDLTYSLLVPRSHPLSNLRAGESYRLIHLALGRCVEQMGWGEAQLSGDSQTSAPALARTCFVLPVEYDLVSNGRKLAGAAQRRTRDGLLHQGSVRSPAGVPVDAARFIALLPGALAAEWSRQELQDQETEAARQLARDKYADLRWTQRR